MPEKQKSKSTLESNNDAAMYSSGFSTLSAPLIPVKTEKNRKPIYLIIGVILIALVVFLFIQNRKSQQLLNDLQGNGKASASEIQKLLSAVGKLAVLPEGENPTIATVTDPKKLLGQPFFDHAVSGDKVLIYTDAKRAILYRPSQDKVIEIAPLNIGGSEETDSGLSGQTNIGSKQSESKTTPKELNKNTLDSEIGQSLNSN